MMRPLFLLAVLAVLAAAAAPGAVLAAPKCTFGTASNLGFGPYDPISAPAADGTSTLTYQCPPGQGVRITLDAGSSGSFAARTMRLGVEVLRYNLYLDAARTTIWGDGSGGSSPGPGVTTRAGSTTTAWVFGRIDAGQDAVAGAYSDTIRVTFEL